jgi:hypothetical protein
MIIVSLIVNSVLFFVILNYSYLVNKKRDPDFPNKPFAQLWLFPLCLGIIFTILVDAFKGVIFYQFVLFALAAILLYWIFFVVRK